MVIVNSNLLKVGESIAEEALKQGDVKTRLESFGLLGLDKHMEVFNTGGKRKRGRKKMVSKKARSSSTKTDDSQAGDTTQNAGSFLGGCRDHGDFVILRSV